MARCHELSHSLVDRSIDERNSFVEKRATIKRLVAIFQKIQRSKMKLVEAWGWVFLQKEIFVLDNLTESLTNGEYDMKS